jgi:hypothetical protein
MLCGIYKELHYILYSCKALLFHLNSCFCLYSLICISNDVHQSHPRASLQYRTSRVHTKTLNSQYFFCAKLVRRARFQLLLKIKIFWNVTPCRLLSNYCRCVRLEYLRLMLIMKALRPFENKRRKAVP